MRVLITPIDFQRIGEEELHRRMLELLDLREKVATLEKDRVKKAHQRRGTTRQSKT
jgi:hypothetical protein